MVPKHCIDVSIESDKILVTTTSFCLDFTKNYCKKLLENHVMSHPNGWIPPIVTYSYAKSELEDKENVSRLFLAKSSLDEKYLQFICCDIDQYENHLNWMNPDYKKENLFFIRLKNTNLVIQVREEITQKLLHSIGFPVMTSASMNFESCVEFSPIPWGTIKCTVGRVTFYSYNQYLKLIYFIQDKLVGIANLIETQINFENADEHQISWFESFKKIQFFPSKM